MSYLPKHSYEEVRTVVIDVILGSEQVSYEPNQFGNLVNGVEEVLRRRQPYGSNHLSTTGDQKLFLDPEDKEFVRDVFWDLFRQGFITLGWNNSNEMWPFFRISHFGQRTLQRQNPYRFHDAASYIAVVRTQIPDISEEAIIYLDEAVNSFYAGCLLATCVMLGVAAEAEFSRLVDIAAASENYGARFEAIPKEAFVRSKISKFQIALKPLLPNLKPKNYFEDVETNLTSIQSVLRIARNEAGHPTGATVPSREQVYVFLQLFVPFARQLMRLRQALA